MNIIKSETGKKRISLVISVLVALAILATLSPGMTYAATKKVKEEIKEPTVSAGSYIVMSGSTSEKVYSVHEDRKMPIGNITKLMTAMVVIDNIHDENEYQNKVDITEKIAKYGEQFKVGDTITVEDLLSALIVGCSDQAAEALASYSASKRGIFVSEMNSKAMEIGLMSTQFANPTGLYDNDHYSTAHESAIIAQYAIRYERIKNLLISDSETINVEGKKNKTVTFTNTNPLMSSTKTSLAPEEIQGGVFGVLDKPREFAQYVGITSRDGMQLIVVMLEANEDNTPGEAVDLLEYGYKKVTKNTIVKGDKIVGHVRIKGGAITKLPVYTVNKGYAYIPPEGSTDLVKTEVVIDKDVTAPISKGKKVGEYRIYVADELKGTVDLVIKKDVKKGWIFSKIYISNFAITLIGIILALVLLVIMRLRHINKRKAKLRAMKKREKIREEARKQEALDRDRKMRKWTYSKYYDSKDMNDALKKK